MYGSASLPTHQTDNHETTVTDHQHPADSLIVENQQEVSDSLFVENQQEAPDSLIVENQQTEDDLLAEETPDKVEVPEIQEDISLLPKEPRVPVIMEPITINICPLNYVPTHSTHKFCVRGVPLGVTANYNCFNRYIFF